MFIPIFAQKGPQRPGLSAAPYRSEVVKRMATFMKSHADFRCQISIVVANKTTLTGKFILSQNLADKSARRDSLKIAFAVTGGPQAYSYVHKGNVSLEIWPRQDVYDRLTTQGFFLPESRQYEGANSFPRELALGFPMPDFYSKSVKATSLGGGKTQYFVTVSTQMGKADRRIILGPHGELLANESRKSGNNPWTGYTCSNFIFKPDPRQKFDTRPPLGLYQYAFDHTLAALTTGQALPNLTLRQGAKTVSSHRVLDPKWTFIVFVDSTLAPGLPDALAEVAKSVKVVTIALHTPQFSSPYPAYTASPAQFDAFGIGATPMFYLIKGTHLDQAWMGFDRKRTDEFLSQIQDALAGKHVASG